MNRIILAAFSALAAFALALPARAQPSVLGAASSPVAIDGCTIIPPAGPNKSGMSTAWIKVGFRNLRSVAADSVSLDFYDLGPSHPIVDKGNFTQGIEIAHSFPTHLRVSSGPRRTEGCTVVAAHFTDGTAWRASP